MRPVENPQQTMEKTLVPTPGQRGTPRRPGFFSRL